MNNFKIEIIFHIIYMTSHTLIHTEHNGCLVKIRVQCHVCTNVKIDFLCVVCTSAPSHELQ
jgi:hypothetical protein